MSLSITGIFWTLLVFVLGFWVAKNYPGLFGGVI